MRKRQRLARGKHSESRGIGRLRRLNEGVLDPNTSEVGAGAVIGRDVEGVGRKDV